MAKDIDYKKSIQEYEKDIVTMKNFVEACRNNPSHLIGYKDDPRAHLSCFREVLQNATDEILREYSPAQMCLVELYEKDGQIAVFDDGRGIPRNSMIRVFTQEFTSSNFKKKDGNTWSVGVNGTGSKCCCALSDYFEVICYICDKYSESGKPEAYTIRFEKGYPTTDAPVDYPNPNNIQGTRVEFKIDESILGRVRPTINDYINLINVIAHLSPIGAIYDIHVEPTKGRNYDIHIVNNSGVLELLNEHSHDIKFVIPPIIIQKENAEHTMKCEVAIAWNANGIDDQEVIHSYANACIVIPGDSTHVKGFLEGLTTYFRDYMNKFVLNDKSKFSSTINDIKSGLRAEVSIFHVQANFSSQSKNVFSNLEAIPFMRDAIKEGLDEWVKTNAPLVDKLCKYFKEVGTLRSKTDNIKIQLNKSAVSVFNNLPLKYDKPSGKEHLELLIVEGDSALGPTLVARDHKRQGCVPIRGKFKNAMTCTKAQFFANEECKGLNAILNCGIGRNCDISNCQFEKIIFLVDSDVDGSQIRTLLLKAFLVYYRNLVEAGRVYTALPPLYSIKLSNGERVYFTDDRDFVSYMFKTFSKENEVRSSDNKKMKNDDIIQLLTDNLNYYETMNILADNHAMDPNVLEYIYSRIIKNENVKQIAKESKKKYPYLEIKQDNGVIVGDGLVNENIETAIFHSDMMKDCKEMISPFLENSDPNGYILNGEKVSLYQLMSAFNKYQPKNLTRYKGKRT